MIKGGVKKLTEGAARLEQSHSCSLVQFAPNIVYQPVAGINIQRKRSCEKGLRAVRYHIFRFFRRPSRQRKVSGGGGQWYDTCDSLLAADLRNYT